MLIPIELAVAVIGGVWLWGIATGLRIAAALAPKRQDTSHP